MKYTDIFLNEVCKNGEYTSVQVDGALVLLPREDLTYYMPKIAIENMQKLEYALTEYINAIRTSSTGCYKIDSTHRINTFLFYLIKSLSNEDCMDFIGYISRVTDYIKDRTFDDLSKIEVVGKIRDYYLLARRCEEHYGSETPYTMRFYLSTPSYRFELPLVRYAIDSEKTAYIYCVQRKKIYKNNKSRVLMVNKMLNEVNSGVKENRNVTPSMLCSLAAFLALAKSEGITQIKADGFLTRRYGHFFGISDDDERDKILANSVDKFFRLFERLEAQSEGIDITSYPLDTDSYMHIRLRDELKSTNPLLDEFYGSSKKYVMTKKD